MTKKEDNVKVKENNADATEAATVNPGRPEHENPTDAIQANRASDRRADSSEDVEVNKDNQSEPEEIPSLEEQKEMLPMPNQKTDSVYMYFPSPVEVDGVNYGAGEVKVAADQVSRVKEVAKGVVELEDIRNVHLGAKPMPKDLNGPDYV